MSSSGKHIEIPCLQCSSTDPKSQNPCLLSSACLQLQQSRWHRPHPYSPYARVHLQYANCLKAVCCLEFESTQGNNSGGTSLLLGIRNHAMEQKRRNQPLTPALLLLVLGVLGLLIQALKDCVWIDCRAGG